MDWPKDKELHLGSLIYLNEKAGARIGALDIAGQRKAKQIMNIIEVV